MFADALRRHVPELAAEKIAHLEAHYELLLRWNQTVNLTSINDLESAVTRHYCESIFLAQHLGVEALRIADIGSGGGFPGFPVAVFRPDCMVTLIESHRRKSVFLREASRKGSSVHVVFCTNDEMALGAVDAVQKLSAAGEDPGELVIVGVDGTREAIATIDSGGTRFRSTIVQDSRRVAETAIGALFKLQAHEPVDIETLIPTTIYPLGDASAPVPGPAAARQSTAARPVP